MRAPGAISRLWAAAADLAFGSVCAGCGEHPGLLCPDCRDELERPAVLGTVPGVSGGSGLVVAAAGGYADAMRQAIIEHKERGRLGLAVPLGAALAVAVTAVLDGSAGCRHDGSRGGPYDASVPVSLVPAPSRARTTRQRGHDPLVRVARRAAVVLRRAGQPATVVPALGHERVVNDQAGLGRAARESNLRGSMGVRGGAAAVLAGSCVVVVDDVLTTGATLRESARALAAAGRAPCAAAVLAAAG